MLEDIKVRCGCIAVGEVQCDKCRKFIENGERYLLNYDEQENTQRLCIDCCLECGYLIHEEEKGKQITTFLSYD